ncbi:MAG: hypothetical protein IKY94_16270 [Lachnospiraceae bacterium]|nr:hypothetical protein [Lachnospiraceae bacterium]
MNVKFTKRILTGALAVALVMAPSVGAFAKTTTSATAPSTTVVETVAPVVVNPFKAVATTSAVAGVKSEVAGAYLLQKGVGVAITSNVAAIGEAYGFAKGETPFVKVFDMDVKKSDKAKASLDGVALAYGGTNVAYIDMEIGKMTNGHYTLLPNGAGIAATFSIPKEAVDVNAKYAVVRVVAGGEFKLLEDTDSNPETISFVTTGGAAAYSIVKY